MKKAIVAMSGGVDSSVAAYLMKKAGYDCIGVTMKLFSNGDVGARESKCCSLEDTEDAKSVAKAVGIPHYVFNFSDKFKAEVIDRFITAYEHGLTPNPCIDCNRYLKFGELFRRADELGCEYIATGHYAKIEPDNGTGRYLLKKSDNSAKDQSYVLYAMTQEQLRRTVFPLGKLSKAQTREIAAERRFVNSEKRESQDICFVQNESYSDFIARYTGHRRAPGNFTDISGNILGRHKGITNYTVGQRKGLGIALGTPKYVVSINPDDNTVILGEEKDLYSKTVKMKNINLIPFDNISEPVRVKAKVRYRAPEQWATVVQTGDDEIELTFDEPQRAVTKGQAAVMYDGDTVVGGGTII